MSAPAANTEAPRKHRPYVPESMEMKEFTFRAVLIGLFLTALLGSANAYLGLQGRDDDRRDLSGSRHLDGTAAVDEGIPPRREHRPNRGLDRRVGGSGRHLHHSGICNGRTVAGARPKTSTGNR